ncbi:arylamine n-acetyltransferase 3 [Fusarium sporotrichioides]|uniref:Arylamine n-acetyltransferase 3 n=1 Tax=Fusarium sporotrichioides TaxID=5514 RepID=A0A395SNZ5_FUSSP|nr:arylamine n-acetyltransferase 3 [Fusarium sporotrichioides]
MMERIRYSESQLETYYDRINLQDSDRKHTISNLSPEAQTNFLFALTKRQLLAVPFENLTLHYSWHRTVDVNADHLFTKIVNEKRGGYCMENNSFFHTVLVSLGFEVYMVAARVFSPDVKRYGGITHCLNVVTIGDKSYAVDVGFGGRTPTIPMELLDGKVFERSDSGQMRLRHHTIPQYLSKQRVWIYEFRSNDNGEWIPQWCFIDHEVLPDDIRVMNMAPSKSPSSFFTFKVVAVQFVSKKEDCSDMETRYLKNAGGDIDGSVFIDGNVMKYRKAGVVKMEKTFESEDERLEALKRYFGIELTEENMRAIRGTACAIP